MVGIELAAQVTPWLASGRTLFLIIHLLGITSFAKTRALDMWRLLVYHVQVSQLVYCPN